MKLGTVFWTIAAVFWIILTLLCLTNLISDALEREPVFWVAFWAVGSLVGCLLFFVRLIRESSKSRTAG